MDVTMANRMTRKTWRRDAVFDPRKRALVCEKGDMRSSSKVGPLVVGVDRLQVRVLTLGTRRKGQSSSRCWASTLPLSTASSEY